MTVITLITDISAPVDRCFDLSRSIDLHRMSTADTNEKAIAGVMSGLISKGESVTWEAVHFGVKQRLTSRIVDMESPSFFSDEMTKGAFKSMYHEHHFEANGHSGTVMKDIFNYEVPFGFAGKIFDRLVLKDHMTRFLIKRNAFIKEIAESNEWKTLL